DRRLQRLSDEWQAHSRGLCAAIRGRREVFLSAKNQPSYRKAVIANERFNAPTLQRFNVFTLQRFNASTLPMTAVANWEEIPLFDSEEAEAAFWSDNRMELRLMEAAVAASSETSESVTISLRIDPRMLARIKRLARSRYLNYQSMIKQWLSERMEQELQERPMSRGLV